MDMVRKDMMGPDNGKQQFILAVEQETGSPAWITIADGLWIHMIGSMMYDYFNNHQLNLINKNLEDKDYFTCEMKYDDYKSAILSGENLRVKDMISELVDFVNSPQMVASPIPTDKIQLCFFSENNPNYISALIENGNIKFGIKIDGKEISDN